ncbi:nuclear transport factor 2 family protein [Streptomyces cylindrosporus]|uniref:Nuclear transport factor 2 family protein n=1 Tax=Streptomyces cylindrosporus TaxID=2927583 RepID=A0ABS9YCU4_9ACTN|nr:nuclear transport factor 2 family protein [Streptomyces cylindrosporus]MCI3275058.1 nuclear transport factor 2 family protein [Streptomyces cylindrosporus]
MTDTTLDAALETPRTIESLNAEVQQFYARHMHLLDSGRAEEWARTFTEDAVFAPEHRPEPVVGRAALTAAVRAAYEGLVAAAEVRRHWHGMVAVEPQQDGSLHVRCYALIVGTTVGADPVLKMSCVCEDVLVRGQDGELKVRERRVTKDGVAAPR